MATLLWIIAVILVIAGIYVLLARRDILWGIVLIVVGLLIGPGGVSIFNV
ncbi:GPGG-motif small membrane protein [Nonomuraea insulae]|uniref:GPGG-motif small membrane protein n=1 Tax=Nonomuraea insulae TaxID=1616787 RepID=A0ABW1CAW7_9ACTN